MMTPYSVLTTVIWSGVFILILFACRRNTRFIMQFGAAPLVFLFGGCVLRCFIPLDFPNYTKVIEVTGWFSRLNAVFIRPLPGLPFSLFMALGFIWLAGTLFCLVRLAVCLGKNLIYLSKLHSTASPQVLEILQAVSQRLGIRNARVIQTEDVPVPAIPFHLCPVVLLPDIAYTDRELEHVLAHELTHWKNRDLWVKLLVQLCCAVFWWNPLVYLLRKDLDQTLELKCDLTVNGDLNMDGRMEYLETILKTMRHTSKRKPFPLAVAAAGFTSGSDAKRMKQRFHCILEYEPNRRRTRLLTALASLLVTVSLAVSFAFVVQPHYDPPPEDITAGGGEEVTPETTYLVKAPDGDYIMYIEGEKSGQRVSKENAKALKQHGFHVKE